MNEKQRSSKIIIYIQSLFFKIDRIFNTLFTSKYNPLYSSGSIAFFLILIMIITGVYLLIFYKVGAPYESLLSIQQDVFLGQFIRGIHRYSSDLAIVAVIFHVFRMLIQNKHYGPRILAWVTGILLLIVLYVSAWTGYILVWDNYAQVLAQSGARIFDKLGIFIDPISRAFDGVVSTPSSSFFFMNLFLHVVLPLLMIFILWIHTSKMARSVWLPKKKFKYGILICLSIVTLIFPLTINEQANLLRLLKEVSGDMYFSFWMVWKDNPVLIIAIHIIIVLIFLSIPWLLKPKDKIATAYNNPNACEGCGQCVEDCPYEAIQMFPRVNGKERQSSTVAVVDDALCVGCGICSGSCGPFTMGPDSKRAGDQLKAVREFFKTLKTDPSLSTLIVGCEHQKINLNKIVNENIIVYNIECVGQLHMAILEILAKPFKKVVVASCHPRSSQFKDAAMMIKDRLDDIREPQIHSKKIKEKISLVYIEPGDISALNKKFGIKQSYFYKIKPVLSGILISSVVIGIGKLPIKFNTEHSILRLSWRLAGQSVQNCTDLNKEDQSKLKHMRLQQQCTRTPVDYKLDVYKNNKLIYERIVSPGGFKSDRPHYVYHDIKLTPNTYDVRVKFTPQHNDLELKTLEFTQTSVELKPGKINLIYYDKKEDKLKIK